MEVTPPNMGQTILVSWREGGSSGLSNAAGSRDKTPPLQFWLLTLLLLSHEFPTNYQQNASQRIQTYFPRLKVLPPYSKIFESPASVDLKGQTGHPFNEK
jgi:hypothetical protein